jgi:class 3 adenylate cyclase
MTEDPSLWMGAGNNDAAVARERRVASICIGDGYIFVFRSAIAATAFSAYLAQLIETLVAKQMVPVEFHFRMGVHFGPVFRFWDFGRKDWNFIGDGINGGQRVLSAVGKDTDDVVFVSSQVRQRIIVENRETGFDRATLAAMLNRGRRADKHGNPWRVYEVNHTALAGMQLPMKLRAGNAMQSSVAGVRAGPASSEN